MSAAVGSAVVLKGYVSSQYSTVKARTVVEADKRDEVFCGCLDRIVFERLNIG